MDLLRFGVLFLWRNPTAKEAAGISLRLHDYVRVCANRYDIVMTQDNRSCIEFFAIYECAVRACKVCQAQNTMYILEQAMVTRQNGVVYGNFARPGASQTATILPRTSCATLEESQMRNSSDSGIDNLLTNCAMNGAVTHTHAVRGRSAVLNSAIHRRSLPLSTAPNHCCGGNYHS